MKLSVFSAQRPAQGACCSWHKNEHLCVCMFVEAITVLETTLSGKWCLIIHKHEHTGTKSLNNSLKQSSSSMMLETHCLAWVYVGRGFTMRNGELRGFCFTSIKIKLIWVYSFLLWQNYISLHFPNVVIIQLFIHCNPECQTNMLAFIFPYWD